MGEKKKRAVVHSYKTRIIYTYIEIAAERERDRDRERVRVLATVPSGIEGKIASAVCQRRLIKAKTE